MKKSKSISFLFILLTILLLPLEALAFNGTELKRETIAPGTTLRQVRWNTGQRNLTVDVLELDLNNPYVGLDVVLGKGKHTQRAIVGEMTANTGAVAMVNGDFYNTLKQGAPFGPVVSQGKVQATPLLSEGMFAFGIDGNRNAYIEAIKFNGSVRAKNGRSFPIGGLNKTDYVINTTGVPSHRNAIHVYDDAWASPSRGITAAGEVLVNGYGIVEEISLNKRLNYPVPAGKKILQINGTAVEFVRNNISKGDKIQVNYQLSPDRNWQTLIGGHAKLVHNGQVLPYTLDIESIGGRRARTAVGVSADKKKVYLATAEGRTKKNAGVTLAEWGTFMKDLGAYQAMNLDGGGSTTMTARHLGDFKADVVTKPEGNNAQRKIVTGLGVYNEAPKGALNEIVVGGPSQIFQGEIVKFSPLKGWDENLHPFDVSGLKYAATDNLAGEAGWSFDRYFAPTVGQTSITLTTTEGVTGQKTVGIRPKSEIASFKLNQDKERYLMGDGALISVFGQVKGREFLMDPDQIQWTLEGIPGTIDTTNWRYLHEDGGVQYPEVHITTEATELPFGTLVAKLNNQEVRIPFRNPAYRNVQLFIGDNKYKIDGVTKTMDTRSFIKQDRTMVPLRFLLEAYGAEVSWDQARYVATVNYRDKVIEMPIGKNYAIINGQNVPLDVSPLLQNDRTMVPLRFLSENLDMTVDYNHGLQSVDVYMTY